MRTLFRLILLLLPFTAGAQQPDTTCYTYPLRNVAGYYSANFGEMRPNHFHSGVDIKTDGTTGKPVVAAADGYVSRIFLSPSGYGRALYVTHPNGTTSVYGHLSKFSPAIEAYLLAERHRRQTNRLDLYCDSTRFPVRRGEEIARSGTSGTSFGPHLHFEIRDNRTGRTLNTIAAGIIRPKDRIPPYIQRIHYLEVDTVGGIPVHSRPKSYDVRKIDPNTYRLDEEKPLPVGRNGYFLVEASDRKDDVSNTFGIYRLRGSVDGTCYFEYCMEGFSFEQTRYCNAVSYYPLQLSSRNEVIRLALLDGSLPSLYRTLLNRGIVSAAPGERREVLIEAEDDCGNRSRLRFTVEGVAEDRDFRARPDTTALPIRHDRTFRYEDDGLQVTIPRGALYESLYGNFGRSRIPLKRDSTLIVLSPVYRILDPTVPLHKALTASIRTFVPKALQKHVTLGGRNRKGQLTHLGGRYENGAVTGRIRTAGDLYVVADTVSPRIRPNFQPGADLSGKSAATFRMTDNFSGITRWTALVDGMWMPLDYDPMRGTATLPFDERIARRANHTLTVLATDACGNTGRWQGSFFR